MGLFVRHEDLNSSNLPVYNIGLSKTLLIVGLGNPGSRL